MALFPQKGGFAFIIISLSSPQLTNSMPKNNDSK